MPNLPAGYFAPAYFSPYYFPSLVAQEHAARYYAPTYFSPYYFPGLWPMDLDALGAVSPPAFRDRDAFEGAGAALRATGAFAGVFVGDPAGRRHAGADLAPAGVLTPVSWQEYDETDPSLMVRVVRFTLTLAVREVDPGEAFDRLDRLSCLAQNALNGSDLGVGCLPALTRLARGTYEPAQANPERRAVLRGEFAYLVPAPTLHHV